MSLTRRAFAAAVVAWALLRRVKPPRGSVYTAAYVETY